MDEQVLTVLKEAEKPLRPGEIAKVLDMDSRDVSAAIARLKEAGKVVSPKRCFYEAAQ